MLLAFLAYQLSGTALNVSVMLLSNRHLCSTSEKHIFRFSGVPSDCTCLKCCSPFLARQSWGFFPEVSRLRTGDFMFPKMMPSKWEVAEQDVVGGFYQKE